MIAPEPYSGKSPESAYETLRFIVLALIAALAVRAFVAQPFVVQGQSMEPTLHSQAYLVVDKVSYRIGNPVRGDIIVFKAPENMTQNYIKRVIGLPGESVRIENERVFVNGAPLDEKYLSLEDQKNLASGDGSFTMERKLGTNEYFVLGDNRQHSSDSRRWGPLPRKNILGKAIITVYPFTDFGSISRPAYLQ